MFTLQGLIALVRDYLRGLEDVEADRALYFLVSFSLVNILTTWLQVFGEALLNDGVTFVLYEGVKELAFVEAEDIKNIPVQYNF